MRAMIEGSSPFFVVNGHREAVAAPWAGWDTKSQTADESFIDGTIFVGPSAEWRAASVTERWSRWRGVTERAAIQRQTSAHPP
jgi:hypothetical protein